MSIVQFVEQMEKIGESSGKELEVSKTWKHMTQFLQVPVWMLTVSETIGQIGKFPEQLVQMTKISKCLQQLEITRGTWVDGKILGSCL